jgi:hypothetical protein
MTPEGKKVVINTDTDECLYEAPHNPPNTGTRFTSGTDLYAHKARSGKDYFYAHYWSMWQGSGSSYTLITPEEMKIRILELSGSASWGLGGAERQRAEKYFPGIFDEDA